MVLPRTIEEFLGDRQFTVLHHRPAYTAQQEAAVAHVPGRQWAKTVTCMADGRPILVMVPAPARVDFDRLREVSGARDIRLASERECDRLYPDCESGAMPPLGPLYGQQVFMDEALAGERDIVFEGGTHESAVKMAVKDFEGMVHPVVGDIGKTREE